MSLLVERDSLTVVGPDAERYLQGQLSNDVARLADGGSAWAFLLEPSGKLGHLCRVLRVSATDFVLDLEPGQAQAAEARLRRFLIRTKVTLSTGSLAIDLDGEGDGTPLIGWWGEGRHTVVEAPDEFERDIASTDHALAAEQQRIDAGWPGPGELEAGLIPGETGVVPAAASFTKGCYTGQELVARIDSRGNNVPFHLRKVLLSSDARPGDELVLDGTVIGRITSVVGLTALGFVARRVDVPSTASIGGSPVSIVDQRSV